MDQPLRRWVLHPVRAFRYRKMGKWLKKEMLKGMQLEMDKSMGTETSLVRIKYLYGFDPADDGTATVFRMALMEDGSYIMTDVETIGLPGWPKDAHKENVCSVCDGTGRYYSGMDLDDIDCPRCKGTGKEEVQNGSE